MRATASGLGVALLIGSLKAFVRHFRHFRALFRSISGISGDFLPLFAHFSSLSSFFPSFLGISGHFLPFFVFLGPI